MAQGLRALTALMDDSGSVCITYYQWLTTTCNSFSIDLGALLAAVGTVPHIHRIYTESCLSVRERAHTHTHTPIHMHIN